MCTCIKIYTHTHVTAWCLTAYLSKSSTVSLFMNLIFIVIPWRKSCCLLRPLVVSWRSRITCCRHRNTHIHCYIARLPCTCTCTYIYYYTVYGNAWLDYHDLIATHHYIQQYNQQCLSKWSICRVTLRIQYMCVWLVHWDLYCVDWLKHSCTCSSWTYSSSL